MSIISHLCHNNKHGKVRTLNRVQLQARSSEEREHSLGVGSMFRHGRERDGLGGRDGGVDIRESGWKVFW